MKPLPVCKWSLDGSWRDGVENQCMGIWEQAFDVHDLNSKEGNMQKALTKKTTAKKAPADSREMLDEIFELLEREGWKCESIIREEKCSHALIEMIEMKNGGRFRILVEGL